jgi:hypothetical protein
MNPDLPADAGPLDPGVSRLFRTLTSEAAHGELAREQDALAMFRAHHHPPTQVITAPPAQRRAPRWRLRLATAGAVAVIGGLAAAAYLAALPPPVQSFAYRELGFLGVPPVHQPERAHGPAARGHTAPNRHSRTSPAPGSSGSGAPGHRTSPAPSARAGADVLSAVSAARNITAGATATIDGKLTRSGSAVAGASVTLLERPALASAWKVAGSGKTTSSGNVTISVSALATNAAFRLTGPDRASSPVVMVTVSPPVTPTLRTGPRRIRDVLVVSTLHARPGNVVVLQVQSASGAWISFRSTRLNTNGKARFVLDGRRLKNKQIRVKLRGGLLHASSLSAAVTVPPPT